ncbi:MAG: DUF2520 domain-containing protein [Actinomycetota bacterium]|nr:DUF2520 domain-containing protein [Actinomycetota bacterium]
MNITIYGPGRAGGAIAIASAAAGHRITGIDGRTPEHTEALRALVHVSHGEPDLLIIAVSDDALATASEFIPTNIAPAVAHLSGAVRVDVLDPFAEAGSLIGAFHPLQTFPDAQTGAERLAGAHVAITADAPLNDILRDLASSLGCHSFSISDDMKPLYHAAAAASANATLAALAVASDLFTAAGVDFAVARPLVDAIVRNAFDLGPRHSLTGPIARGDIATVTAQLEAVRSAAPDLVDAFVNLGRATAAVAGTSLEFAEVWS